jgi:hypothetical protein
MATTTPKLIVQLKSKQALQRRRGLDPAPNLSDNNPVPMEIVDAGDAQRHLWDQAHDLVKSDEEVDFAEPDMLSQDTFMEQAMEAENQQLGDAEKAYYSYIDYWPHPEKPALWHLEDDYAGLRSARQHIQSLGAKKKVRIAHLDTGYFSKHISFPKDIINTDLQRNFAEGEDELVNNAEDLFVDGTLKMPGHGTGTLSILAGTKVNIPEYGFDDYLGLHDLVEIVPIRIAKSVVLFKSSGFVQALDYILNELNAKEETRIHIITMSMGGLPSKAWAQMVNEIYEQGVFMVTAAGNNFGKLPARTMVYPARFNRVVAACGVTYDKTPYVKPHGEGGVRIMEGNYGPTSLMNTAIAAFTPNVIWATYKYPGVVGIRGDGTSSATPQIASAAALYYIKHYDALEALPEPWMRVEAIRKALFETASKEIAAPYEAADCEKYFGNGTLQARKMLDIPVAAPAALKKQPRDKIFFPFLKMILGIRKPEEEMEDEMLETELMQLILTDPALQKILNNEETKLTKLSNEEQAELVAAVLNNPNASETLKQKMRQIQTRLT